MVIWARNFADQLLADYEAYGVSLQAAQAFEAAAARFAQSYEDASDPKTRTMAAVARKRADRFDMERMARSLSRIITAQPTVADEDRILLGLTVAKPRVRRLPAPAEAPTLRVREVRGGTITLTVENASNIASRARPRGTAGATVDYCIASNDPNARPTWSFLGNTSVTRATMTLPALPPNTCVYLRARWYNARGELGPTSVIAQTWTTHAGLSVPLTSMWAA